MFFFVCVHLFTAHRDFTEEAVQIETILNLKRQLFLGAVKEALGMRAVSALRFSHSDRCEAFDTSDHTVLFVRLQHRLAASVLTLSFQQSFLCL